MPACGRAISVFSTFTDSAGRVTLAPLGSGRPVSGAVGTATVVVVGAAVVVVVLGVAAWDPPPHADAISARAAATAATPPSCRDPRFTGSLHLLQPLDAVLEGWVGVEQVVELGAGLLLVGLERLLDPHLGRGLGGVVHDRVVVPQLFQSRDQPR